MALCTLLIFKRKCLKEIEQKAKKKNAKNIKTFLIKNTVIDINYMFDFILAFWMFHEVAEKETMLKQLKDILKTNANFLIVEPIIHVNKTKFTAVVEIAKKVGFDIIDYPKISISKAVVLRKR